MICKWDYVEYRFKHGLNKSTKYRNTNERKRKNIIEYQINVITKEI